MNNPAAFVLAQTDQGLFIVNRFDRMQAPSGGWYGVGLQLLETGSYDAEEINKVLEILDHIHTKKENVIFVDCGANIGVHTICAARHMRGWGQVVAFEPQLPIFYALCGNIALNNLDNVKAYHAAVGNYMGTIDIPKLKMHNFGSFGSLSLLPNIANDVGQKIESTYSCDITTLQIIDSIIDFIKIDVEGMEFDVLQGYEHILKHDKPWLLIEYVKSNKLQLQKWLTEHSYKITEHGINLLCEPRVKNAA